MFNLALQKADPEVPKKGASLSKNKVSAIPQNRMHSLSLPWPMGADTKS